MIAAKLATLTKGRPKKNGEISPLTNAQAADLLSIDATTAKLATLKWGEKLSTKGTNLSLSIPEAAERLGIGVEGPTWSGAGVDSRPARRQHAGAEGCDPQGVQDARTPARATRMGVTATRTAQVGPLPPDAMPTLKLAGVLNVEIDLVTEELQAPRLPRAERRRLRRHLVILRSQFLDGRAAPGGSRPAQRPWPGRRPGRVPENLGHPGAPGRRGRRGGRGRRMSAPTILEYDAITRSPPLGRQFRGAWLGVGVEGLSTRRSSASTCFRRSWRSTSDAPAARGPPRPRCARRGPSWGDAAASRAWRRWSPSIWRACGTTAPSWCPAQSEARSCGSRPIAGRPASSCVTWSRSSDRSRRSPPSSRGRRRTRSPCPRGS